MDNKKLTNLMLYGVGLVVGIVGLTFGASRIKQATEHQGQHILPGNNTNQDAPRQVRIVKPPQVLYRLVAEGLIRRMKPTDQEVTFREYEALANQTAVDLQTNLGLTLPTGFTMPPDVPAAWLEAPTFNTMQDYVTLQKVGSANFNYLRSILSRLVDEYAAPVVELMSRKFQEGKEARREGDETSLSFLKALYGADFIKDFDAARNPVQPNSEAPGKIHVLPESLIRDGEREISSYWRTEFSNAELGSVRDYIVAKELGAKLRSDLLHSDMSETEKGLLEKDLLGYRISVMQSLTIKRIGARCAKVANTTSN